MVRGEDDVGVVGDPQVVDLLEHLPESDVQIEVRRRFGDLSFAQIAAPTLHGGARLWAGIATSPRRVVRKLEIARFAPSDLSGHEIQPALGHGVELLGMRIGYVVRATVAVRPVVLIETMLVPHCFRWNSG